MRQIDVPGNGIFTHFPCRQPSHVLTAMGLRQDVVQGSPLRFSLSCDITDEEIDRALDLLVSVTERLRRLSHRTCA